MARILIIIIIITTVKDQMGLPWYHGRGVNVRLGMSQLQTLMPGHTLHRQRFEPVQQRNGPSWTKQTNITTYFPITSSFHSLAKLAESGASRALIFWMSWVVVHHLLRVIRMKHIIFTKDFQLLYREVMQLASVVVFLLLTSAMINTPPSATPNYIHPQYLMPPGT